MHVFPSQVVENPHEVEIPPQQKVLIECPTEMFMIYFVNPVEMLLGLLHQQRSFVILLCKRGLFTMTFFPHMTDVTFQTVILSYTNGNGGPCKPEVKIERERNARSITGIQKRMNWK